MSAATYCRGRPVTDTQSQTNGVFQLNIKNKEGKEVIYVLDLKKDGTVSKGTGIKPGEYQRPNSSHNRRAQRG
jgi:hypothetical protein